MLTVKLDTMYLEPLVELPLPTKHTWPFLGIHITDTSLSSSHYPCRLGVWVHAEGFHKTSRQPHALHFWDPVELFRAYRLAWFRKHKSSLRTPITIILLAISPPDRNSQDVNGKSSERLLRDSARSELGPSGRSWSWQEESPLLKPSTHSFTCVNECAAALKMVSNLVWMTLFGFCGFWWREVWLRIWSLLECVHLRSFNIILPTFRQYKHGRPGTQRSLRRSLHYYDTEVSLAWGFSPNASLGQQ
jgi:hypothetical protein